MLIQGGHCIQNSKLSFCPRNIGPFTAILEYKIYCFAAFNVKAIRNCSSQCNKKGNVRWQYIYNQTHKHNTEKQYFV